MTSRCQSLSDQLLPVASASVYGKSESEDASKDDDLIKLRPRIRIYETTQHPRNGSGQELKMKVARGYLFFAKLHDTCIHESLTSIQRQNTTTFTNQTPEKKLKHWF